jgi:hypothetical protein
MPEELEAKLWVIAKRKFPNDPEKQKAYVYGTLRNTGWKPDKEKGK